jgi:hypothetical protein
MNRASLFALSLAHTVGNDNDGFWSARIGRVTVQDWNLEVAVASLLRVKRYARAFRRMS